MTKQPSVHESSPQMIEEYKAIWHKVRLEEITENISYGYTANADNMPIGPKFLRITDIQGEVVLLSNSRDWLLSKLSSGKLQIKDPKDALREAI